MKFCKDCKWVYVDEQGIGYAKCEHPDYLKEDDEYPVSGMRAKVGTLSSYCSALRIARCGRDARNWEAQVPDGIERLDANWTYRDTGRKWTDGSPVLERET